MRFSQQLYFLVVLAIAFSLTAAGENSTSVNIIIGDVKSLLVREGGKLSKNTTSGPLIPSDDIVGQIITLLNCGSFPHAPNSHLQYSLDYENKNLRLFQTCDRYFKTSQKNESLQVQCKYKKWVFNKIQCEIITCPRLTVPAGGHFSTSENTYNTTVYFWCSCGFTINGTDKLFCEKSGLWNLPPPTCHLSSCRPLPLPRHGFVSSQEGTTINQTVVFTCESEYTLIGDAVLRCEENGRWNTSAPVCKKMCMIPNVNSHLEGIRLIPGLKIVAIGSLIKQGQRVIFSCKPGYTVPSSGISTCIGGNWRPTIQCRKTCTVIESPNGNHILSKDSFTIEYFCLPGYKLIGQQKLSCTPNITWDNEVPICTKMCTLSKRHNVLSYRNKQTYEILPFGVQVINGTQVYAICRSNSSNVRESECVDGELSLSLCKDRRARMQTNYFELFDNDQWHPVCKNSSNICGMFGYKVTDLVPCLKCHDLNVEEYRRTSSIVLQRQIFYTRYPQLYCMRCF